MTTRELGKSKLARSIALGLTLGTSLYWGGVANAATTYYGYIVVGQDQSGQQSNTAVVGYNGTSTTGTDLTISGVTIDGIYGVATNNGGTNDNQVIDYSSGASRDYTSLVYQSGAGIITENGANNTITISGNNVKEITFATAAAKDSNTIEVSGTRSTLNITDAKSITVDAGATVGAISSTAGSVTTGEGSVTGDVSNTTGYVKTGDNSTTGNISSTTGYVTTGDNSTTGNISNTNGYVTTGTGSTVGNIDGVGGNVTVQGTAGYVKDTNGTNGVTLVNATITGGADAAGIDSTMAGGVTQTTGNSVISGSTGITTTKGSVTLTGTAKTLSTVTGAKGGIYGTGGSVVLNNETVKSTDSGDAINGTGGDVDISNSEIDGAANGISTTTGNVSINNTTVTGANGAGITDTAGNVTQTTGNSVISGTTFGITTTQGSVELIGANKNSSTVTGVQGGIYGTDGSVVLNNETVKSTTSGDAINGTGGDVDVTNSEIDGHDYGINATTGKVTVDSTPVTGETKGGIYLSGSDVVVKNGSSVEGKGGDGIAYTGYTSTTEKSATSSVTVTDSSVKGSENGINFTNGSVDVTGSSTKNASVTGTAKNGIANTAGKVSTAYATVLGGENGISDTAGNVEINNDTTITGKDGAGITDTTGNVTQKSSTTTISGTTFGIMKTGGSVSLTGQDKNTSTVTGKTGGIYKTGGDLYLKNETVTTGTDSTSGDAINDVAGKVTLDGDTIYSNAGSGIVTDEGTRTTANTNTVSLKDTQVTGKDGDGVNAKYRTDVVLNGVTVTAKDNGVIAGDPNGTAGNLHITTTSADNTMTVGNSGIVAYNDKVVLDGNTNLVIKMNNDGTDQDVHKDAAIKMMDGSTLDNPTAGADITIGAADSASGLIAKGTGSSITFTTQPANITSDATAVNVDGIYTADGGNVDVENGKMNLQGTGEVNGVHAVAADIAGEVAGTSGSTVTLSNLGANFSVAATGQGVANGVLADGDGTIVKVDGTDLDKVTSENGAATGLAGSNKAAINVTMDDNNVSNDIVVTATGTGSATGVSARSGATNTVTGKESKLTVSSQGGNVIGVIAGDENSKNTLTGMADMSVTTTSSNATGLQAQDGGTNEVNTEATTNLGTLTVSTGSGDARGISAQDSGSSNTVAGLGAITASGTTTTVGVYAFNSGTNTVNKENDTGRGDITVTSTTSSAHGVMANGDDTSNTVYGYDNIKVDGGAASTFADNGFEVSGVYASGTNSSNTVVLSGGIEAKGAVSNAMIFSPVGNYKVYGVTAQTADSTNDVTMNGDIVAEGGRLMTSYGTMSAIDANGGTNTINGVKSILAKEVAGAEATAYGIHSNNSGTNNVNVKATTNMGTLTATGDNGQESFAYGITAENSSTNTVAGLGAITVTAGAKAYGINAESGSKNIVNHEGDTNRGDIIVTANAAAGGVFTGGVAYGVSATTTDVGASSNKVYGYNNISVTGVAAATGIEATGNDKTNTATNTVAMSGALTTKSATGPSTGITATNYAANTVTGVTNIDASTTTSGDATGITATDGTNSVNEGQETYTGYITATTPSGTATGIAAKSTGKKPASNIVAGVTYITAEGSGNANGIEATGKDATNTATNTVNMNGAILATSTDAGTAAGVSAATYADNTVKTATSITASSNIGTAYGVDASDHSSNTVDMTGNLSASSTTYGEAYAVRSNDNSTNIVTGTKDIEVATAQGTVYGIDAEKDSSNTVDMTGNLSASSTTYGDAYAVRSNDNSKNTVTGTKDIEVATAQGNAYGIDAVKDSTNNVNKGVTTGLGSLTVNSNTGNAYGVNADVAGGEKTTYNYVGGLTKMDVTSIDGDAAYGVNATGGTSTTKNSLNDVHMTGDITVTATLDWNESASAYGVNADEYGSNTVEGSKNISATATVGDAYAVKASGTDAVNTINETAKSDKGSVTAITDNGAAYAIAATEGGTNTLGGVTSVEAKGTTGASGINANTNSVNTVAMNGNLTAKSTGTEGAYPVYAVNAHNSSTNNVTGTKNITATDTYGNAYGINATEGSTNNVNKDVTKTMGDMTVSSDNGTAYGITADAFSTTINTPTTNNVGGLGKVTVTSTKDTAVGIDVAGGDADNLAANNVNLTGDITVKAVTSGDAYGVNADEYGSNTVEGSKNISATATVGDAYAVKASGTEAVNKINETITEVTTENEKGSVTAKTDNGAAYAIQATDSGANTLGGVTSVEATGTTGAAGINAASDVGTISTNEVYMDSTLTATNSGEGEAAGIAVQSSGSNTVEGVTAIEALNTGTGNAYGIKVYGAGSNKVNETITTVTAENAKGSITATADNGSAYGIYAKTFAETATNTNTVGGVTDITATGSGEAYGVNAEAYPGAVAGAAGGNKIYMNGAITATSTQEGTVAGVYAVFGGQNIISTVTNIKAQGVKGDWVGGIVASSNSNNDVTMTGDLSAKASTSGDVYAVYGNNSTNKVEGTKNISATTTSGTAYGIDAVGDSINNVNEGKTEAMGSLTVVSENGAAAGIFADAIDGTAVNNVGGLTTMDVTSTAGDAYGVNAKGGASDTINSKNVVNLTGDITVKAATSGSAYGVNADAYGNNTVTGTGATNLSVKSTDGTAIGFEAGTVGVEEGGTSAVNTATGLQAITVDGTATNYDVIAGLEANGSGVNNVTMDGALTVNGNTKYYVEGLGAYGGTSKNTLKGVTDIIVTGTGATNYVDGVYASAGTASNDITMNGKISAKGSTEDASGVEAHGGGTNTIQGTVTSIEAEGAAGDVYGVLADKGTNTITMSSGLVSANATALAAGNEVAAVYADHKGVNNFTGLTAIKATGASTEGGTVNGIEIGGYSTITNDATLDVTADAMGTANAIGLQINDGDNTLPTLNSLAVTSEDGTAKGINADGGTNTVEVTTSVSAKATGSGNAGGVNTTGDAELTTTIGGTLTATAANGDAAAVNAASSGNTTVTVNGTTTVEAPNGSEYGGATIVNNEGTGTVTFNANGAMSATGNRAGGVNGAGAGTTTINGNGNTVTLKGTDSSAAALVTGGSKVTLINLKMDSQAPDKKAYSIFAYGTDGAEVNLEGTTIASSTTTNSAADIAYQNGSSAVGQDLNITIDSTSGITGAANVVDDSGTPSADNDSAALGAINITNAGTWNVTGDSNLNASGESSLTNTGLVDMTKDGTTAEKQVSSKLAVKSLTHNGNLIMDVSPEKVTTGDQIVTTTTSGSGKIKANILASEQDATYKDFLDTALITATGTADGNYSVTNNGDNNLEVGNWTYSLQPMKQADGSTIYHLVNNDLLSNKGKTIVSSVVSPDYWYYETNALYSDINNFNGARKDHDVWAHMVHNKTTLSNFSDQSGVDDVDSQYSGVVVGIDKKFSQSAKGSFWGGIMGGYGKASESFTGGDADLNSAHVGVYGVYRTTTDWYVGSILKYNRYSTDISSTTSAGTAGGVHTSDDLSQTGWGLSVIGGKRFTNNKGWFVEPQLELGYHRISEGDYTLGGTRVNVDAMTSKRVRAGFNVGKTIAYQSGANLDVFAQASMIHEFGGDGQITASNKYYPNNGSDNLEAKFDGTWGQYKLGLNYNTAKGDNGILALTYNQGSRRHSPLGFELSYNWTF